ncbi:AHH domain-containing protein [Corallococcus sp. bb12-1]|uniref:AHH domain-containing protein n=1 Tax=Corallococcus sp. bb12-1 TaxID=2996784 RepID=UPI00226FF188|nr:AHH domain-containing protein [Corallococcus sp. bb12-1]MCY1046516.1 AHH domain-containing protein [Corallococcus sp. bb12-1]
MTAGVEYLSAKKLQTKAATLRQKLIEDSFKKKKFTATAKKSKAKKKKSGAAKKQPHANSVRELRGVLAKDAHYAQNGHDYLLTDGGRNKVFKNFDLDFAHKHTGVPKKHLEDYRFPSLDLVQNFNKGARDVTNPRKKAGQRYPYLWEAHHILPGSSFYYEDEVGPCFELWQLRLILQGEYNLNHGHNIIPLPDESWAVPIHQTPQHPSDHPVYTQGVMTDLRKIARNLEEARDKGAPHPDLKALVFEELQELEDKFWKVLTSLGRQLAQHHVKGRKLERAWVTYGTKKNPTKYEWGALY